MRIHIYKEYAEIRSDNGILVQKLDHIQLHVAGLVCDVKVNDIDIHVKQLDGSTNSWTETE